MKTTFKDCLLLLVLKLIRDFFSLELTTEELILTGSSCYLATSLLNPIVSFSTAYMTDIVVYAVHIVISG